MAFLPIESYRVAASVRQALALRRAAGRGGAYLAGGTRLFREERRDRLRIIDIGRLGLGGIRQKEGCLSIGATATLQDLLEHPLAARAGGGLLAGAAGATLSWMVRNAATVGGLLADGSPDLDLLPALLVLDSRVASQRGRLRRESLEDFLRSARPAETLILSVEIPSKRKTRGGFERLSRTAHDVSLVSLAAALHLDGGRISGARLAASGSQPGPLRLRRAESVLEGKPPAMDLFARAAHEAAAECALAGDHRATAQYRREMVGVLVGRALARAAQACLLEAPGASRMQAPIEGRGTRRGAKPG